MKKNKNRKIVVFDFDKTLTLKDTNLDFFKYVGKPLKFYYLRLGLFVFLKVARKLGAITNINLKNLAILLFLQNYSREQYILRAQEFASSISMNNRLVSVLEEHKRDNCRIVITSASLEDYIKPIFPDIEVIGSILDYSRNRIKLLKHCYKESKLDCLKEKGIDDINILYTDSKSDLPLVSISDEIFLVKKYKIIHCKSKSDFIKALKSN